MERQRMDVLKKASVCDREKRGREKRGEGLERGE